MTKVAPSDTPFIYTLKKNPNTEPKVVKLSSQRLSKGIWAWLWATYFSWCKPYVWAGLGTCRGPFLPKLYYNFIIQSFRWMNEWMNWKFKTNLIVDTKLFYPTNIVFFWNVCLVGNFHHISQTGENPVLFSGFTAKIIFFWF